MSLDTVELVLEIEERFGIEIPDAEAESLQTVGQCYAYVLARMLPRASRGCLCQAAFYRLRRAIVSLTGVARCTIRPGTRLADVLPRSSDREFWSRLSAESQLQLPDLLRPRWMRTCGRMLGHECTTLALALGAAGLAAWLGASPAVLGAATLAGLLVLMLLAHGLTQQLAVNVGESFATVGGLTQCAVGANSTKLREGAEVAAREDVWICLRGLICKHLGVTEDEVRPEASFVNDLGAG